MQTKLTLRLERALIERAKAHASRTGTSLSRMVAGYFALLDRDDAPKPDLPPTVRALYGALAGASVEESDYRRHLEEKHR